MSSVSSDKMDEEKGAPFSTTAPTNVVAANDGVDREHGFIGKLWKVVKVLDSYGVEARGIERVPADQRHHGSLVDSGLLWLSANLTISTFSLGTLGKTIWYMGLIDSALTITFFNLLCTLPVALFSTWGMQTGLRQMVIGRYSFGSIGIYFPVVLNIIACLGWSTINTIVGASALQAVSTTNELPIAAGTVIIAILTLIVALFGYKVVHTVERYASIPVLIIFIIMLGQAAPYVTSATSGAVGAAEAANVLSFGGTVAGFALGWTSLAADYTVNFPENSSKTKVFIFTYLGLNIPLIFCEIMGAVVINTFDQKTTWETMYTNGKLGGLLGAPLVGPMGNFGRFLLVLLALSIVANNIPNMYSFALTFQTLGKYAQAVPRFFLVIIGTIIYIVLAIVGADHFQSFLDTMLVILSYWLAIYSVILIEEHYLFRGGSFAGYDLDRSNDHTYLPRGYAALMAVCFGIAGAVLGMSQVWYVGVIGRLIGDPKYGGDIGFELAAAFSGIMYPIFRHFEIKLIGR